MPSTPPGRGRKVVVAMSGGVDSSVAALLLKQQGYDVVGCFMRLGPAEESTQAECTPSPRAASHQGCCSLNDAADARHVAAILDVPFYALNFRADFHRVIDYFVAEYHAGRTPNPCVRCNDWLKFGKLLDYARSIDADFVATGHYARTAPDPQSGRAMLLRGLDHGKDQSYVLFGLDQATLDRVLLPIGDLHKSRVRQIALEHGLPVHDKPDSQEICFVPGNDYARLVRKHSPDKVQPGPILDTHGRTIGEHPGHQHFTVGQRRGLNLAVGYPIYVVAKDAAANSITIGQRVNLFSAGLRAGQTNWLIDPPTDFTPCTVKIRANSPPTPAVVRAEGADALEVHFDRPQSAVSPGQAVVCYHEQRLIGGGWITHALPADPAPTMAADVQAQDAR
ncbi:MAG: tRNA 2-thiouridine(34) synthase MnmA [Phycisphaeraceae bacterium]|nr:tRNA 2-thiouridine(34) synthase MnmA [Phycisphaeraceae bacterium]